MQTGQAVQLESHFLIAAERLASAADRRGGECEPRRRWALYYVKNRSDRAVGCTLC
jgi:hypothetical protein